MNLEVDAAPKDADASTLSLDGVVRLDRRGKAGPEAGGGSMGRPPRTQPTRPKRVLPQRVLSKHYTGRAGADACSLSV